MDPIAGVDGLEEEKNFLPLLGFELRTVQPAV
jgi:hypothetical protein